jgi:hypothetical protein
MRISDFEIETAAKARFNCARVEIIKYSDTTDPFQKHWNYQPLRGELQVWYGLAIQRVEGGEWQTMGRRRTRDELLAMIESRAC